MPTQLLRPTQVKGQKNQCKWWAKGPWGRRPLGVMSANSLRRQLHGELIDSGLLPADSPAPSNSNHWHVTKAIYNSSWIGGRWVADGPLDAG
jgi:hypothetical protein